MADETSPLLPKDESHSRLGRLWLESREIAARKDVEADPASLQTGLAPNQFRALTLRNFKLSFQLAVHCFPYFIGLLWKAHKLALILSVVCSIISGFVPTLTAWLGSKLLDEVQHSFQTGEVRLDRIKLFSSLSIGISFFNLFFRYVTSYSSSSLRREIQYLSGVVLCESRLRLDISGLLEPFRRDVLESAEVFCFKRPAIDRRGGNTYDANAYNLFYNTTSTLTALSTLASSFLLLFSTLSSRTGDQKLFRIQLTLVLIAMTPSLLGVVSTFTTYRSRQRWNPVLHRRLYNLGKFRFQVLS
jgi:ABC-type multidrug transport system fused ATPase/permease subunit